MQISTMKQIIFAVFLVLVLLAIYAAISLASIWTQYTIWILIFGAFLLLIWKFDFILMLKDYERSVIFRFGKVHRVGGPGWCLILPGIEESNRVDLRVHTIDIPRQDVVTKDKIELNIDAVIYLAVKKDKQSVINSVVAVRDYKTAATDYAIATLRDVMGGMDLSEVLVNIEGINRQLKEMLEKISEGWGVSVDAVQIKDINIPKTVIEAMHAEKAAEQEKLARMQRAEAQQAEIDAVKESAAGLSENALSYYYIRALEKMAEGQSTKFIFPMELSGLASALSGKIGISKGSGGINISPEILSQLAPLLKSLQKSSKAKKAKARRRKKAAKKKR